MRQQHKRALEALDAGQTFRGSNCFVDKEGTLWNYTTAIVVKCGDGRVLINGSKYSATTSTLQRAARTFFPYAKELSGFGFDATRADIEAAAQ